MVRIPSKVGLVNPLVCVCVASLFGYSVALREEKEESTYFVFLQTFPLKHLKGLKKVGEVFGLSHSELLYCDASKFPPATKAILNDGTKVGSKIAHVVRSSSDGKITTKLGKLWSGKTSKNIVRELESVKACRGMAYKTGGVDHVTRDLMDTESSEPKHFKHDMQVHYKGVARFDDLPDAMDIVLNQCDQWHAVDYESTTKVRHHCNYFSSYVLKCTLKLNGNFPSSSIADWVSGQDAHTRDCDKCPDWVAKKRGAETEVQASIKTLEKLVATKDFKDIRMKNPCTDGTEFKLPGFSKAVQDLVKKLKMLKERTAGSPGKGRLDRTLGTSATKVLKTALPMSMKSEGCVNSKNGKHASASSSGPVFLDTLNDLAWYNFLLQSSGHPGLSPSDSDSGSGSDSDSGSDSESGDSNSGDSDSGAVS